MDTVEFLYLLNQLRREELIQQAEQERLIKPGGWNLPGSAFLSLLIPGWSQSQTIEPTREKRKATMQAGFPKANRILCED